MKKWKCKYCNEILMIEKKQNISNHYLRCDDYKEYRDTILTKDFLIEEYVKKEKSAYEISKEINIGVNPILRYIDKFGIKHRNIKEATNLDRCRNKYKKTCMNLYGAENALSKDTIPYKNRNKTVLDRYGVDNVRKHPDIINDIKIKVDKWRKENNTHSTKGMKHNEITRKEMRKSALRYIKSCKGKISPHYNKKSIPIIEQYGKENGYNFQHAENGGEYHIKELGYFVDGYDKKKNVVLEIDEKHHYNVDGTLKEKDIQRQKEIEEHLGCKFIRLKFND